MWYGHVAIHRQIIVHVTLDKNTFNKNVHVTIQSADTIESAVFLCPNAYNALAPAVIHR